MDAGADRERARWAAAAAAVAADVAEEKRAACNYAARAAAVASATETRAAGNGAAIARLYRLASVEGCGVVIDKGRLWVAPAIGAAAMVAATCAAIGSPDTGRRADIARAAAAAKRSIGKGWHTEQAKRAQVVYLGLLADESRAMGAALFRSGLLGRASARAARIGWAMGRRWLRLNSRREALAVAEIGAAAGVDDLQAGNDWAAELQAIAGAVHQRAACYGVAMVAAPLPACAALVARGYSGGLVSSLRSAVLGRGRRVDGVPVVEWTDKGRQVAADSIGTLSRGIVWLWAARVAGREMHSARYGRGGRDGREVAAGWSVSGDLAEVNRWERDKAAGADFSAWISNPWRVAPTRRPSVVQSARDSLAADCIEARAAVAAARAAVAAAPTRAARIEAGGMLGNARRVLALACKRARALGRAMRGQSLHASAMADWLTTDTSGKTVLTGAGRMVALRLRSAQALEARATGAVMVVRVPLAAGVHAGDEMARAESVASFSAR